MLKLIILPRTRPGLTRTELHSYLADVHGPLVMRHADVSGVFRRYVHHYATEAALDPMIGDRVLKDRDSLTMIEFDGIAGFQSSISSDGYKEDVGPDEANFSQRDGSLFFFVVEAILRSTDVVSENKLFHLRRFNADVDRASASRAWCVRVGDILSGGIEAVSSYSHNLITPGDTAAAYDAIDEIGFEPNGQGAQVVGAALARAEDGLFEPTATAAVVTRSRVFI